MTCCRCSAPALIHIPDVAGWCKAHAWPMAGFSARRLEELEARNDSRLILTSGVAA